MDSSIITNLTEAVVVAGTALLIYIAAWLRSHVGKSNGLGSLNQQSADLHTKIDDLSRRFQRHVNDELITVERIQELLDTQQCDHQNCEGCSCNCHRAV